jgi:uracil-DNA glycosylase
VVLDDVWSLFENRLFTVPSTWDGPASLFNQYHDRDLQVDRPDAGAIRRSNLFGYLSSFTERPSVLIVGEAPGWRGCRFSGVPFTSEAQLCDGALPFTGHQSSAASSPYAENTATIFWRIAWPHASSLLAWNCVPFHLHRPDDPLTNRPPTRREILAHLDLLAALLALLELGLVVAVGRTAGWALHQIDVPCTCVCHPSHGGAEEFRRGLENVLR